MLHCRCSLDSKLTLAVMHAHCRTRADLFQRVPAVTSIFSFFFFLLTRAERSYEYSFAATCPLISFSYFLRCFSMFLCLVAAICFATVSLCEGFNSSTDFLQRLYNLSRDPIGVHLPNVNVYSIYSTILENKIH